MRLVDRCPFRRPRLVPTWPCPRLAQDGEIITKQYDDGSVYEGTFKNGRQHGTGTYKLPSGFEYSGEWVDGEITGQGTARYPNGSVYEGAFVNGQPEGKGKITCPGWPHL